ncbi:putative Glucosamine 6-phosphate N-acetyltransferase (putative) [Pseudozyma hubeiensis]|nr:putative Glucosamine 6-phosphate N-acetyltransferase (putative) [Pseudozyma hubeiensis]
MMPSVQETSTMKLAFPTEDIPQECFATLPDGYTMRPLASSDYGRGFNEVLECLVETPDEGEAAWKGRFDAMVAANGTYYPIVIVSKETDRIVAMGTVVVELKFFRGLTKVGHVEDIVVDTRLHSKGLGKIVVETVKAIGISKGCSGIILNCSDEKKPFYEKCGFTYSGLQMAKRLR